MKTIVKICRILVGLLFIFSGFVKADDPLGFTYKLLEYFDRDALNLTWLNGTALYFSFFIPVLEMILGMMILIGARKKITLLLLVLMTLFFTFLTWYTAHYNKVLECGCFGDAIPMTAWQSFYKNIGLLVLIFFLIVGNKHITPAMKPLGENAVMILFIVGCIFFTSYCYNYLPVLDFRPYKPGTDIKKDMVGTPDVLKYFYILKNKKTGVDKEFEKFPEGWKDDWDYVNSRTVTVKKGVEPKIKDFSINTLGGDNYTDSILTHPDYSLLLISSSISDAAKSPDFILKINALAGSCNFNHIKFICLTASSTQDIDNYKRTFSPPYLFYNTDETVLRTMIRSNPGLMLLKDGIVIHDWHYHSIPSYGSLNLEYFHRS